MIAHSPAVNPTVSANSAATVSDKAGAVQERAEAPGEGRSCRHCGRSETRDRPGTYPGRSSLPASWLRPRADARFRVCAGLTEDAADAAARFAIQPWIVRVTRWRIEPRWNVHSRSGIWSPSLKYSV